MDKYSNEIIDILREQKNGIEVYSVSKIVLLLSLSSEQRKVIETVRDTRPIWDRLLIYSYIIFRLNETSIPISNIEKAKYHSCLKLLLIADTELADTIAAETILDSSYFFLDENKQFLDDVVNEIEKCNSLDDVNVVINLSVKLKPRFFMAGHLLDLLNFLFFALESGQIKYDTARSEIVSWCVKKIDLILFVRQGDVQKISKYVKFPIK